MSYNFIGVPHALSSLGIIIYNKACLKWPLKNRQNKDPNDEW